MTQSLFSAFSVSPHLVLLCGWYHQTVLLNDYSVISSRVGDVSVRIVYFSLFSDRDIITISGSVVDKSFTFLGWIQWWCIFSWFIFVIHVNVNSCLLPVSISGVHYLSVLCNKVVSVNCKTRCISSHRGSFLTRGVLWSWSSFSPFRGCLALNVWSIVISSLCLVSVITLCELFLVGKISPQVYVMSI